jgi:hypothetical protein
VQAQVRKLPGQAGRAKTLQIGEILIDRAQPAVEVAGRPNRFHATEFKFAHRPDGTSRPVCRHASVAERRLGGYEAAIESRTVDIYVTRLRGKLGRAATHLETVHGFGYRFVEKPAKWTENLWPEILARIQEASSCSTRKRNSFRKRSGPGVFEFGQARGRPKRRMDEAREIIVRAAQKTRRIVVTRARWTGRNAFHLRDVTAERALEEVGTEMIAKSRMNCGRRFRSWRLHRETWSIFRKMLRSEQTEIFEIMQEHAYSIEGAAR